MRLQCIVMMDGLSGRQAEAIGHWPAAGFPPRAHKRPGRVCAQPLAEAARPLERPPNVTGHAGDTVIPKREDRLDGARAGTGVPRKLTALGLIPTSTWGTLRPQLCGHAL